MGRSGPLADPGGTARGTRTARGGTGELSQRLGDARYEQEAVSQDTGDPEGVGDTVRGWFRRAR